MYSWEADGHKIFRYVLAVQFVISIAIGLYTGEIAQGIIFSIVIVAVPMFLSFQQPESRLSRMAIGVGTQLMAALHIHQSYGLTEIHFEIFVLLAFLGFFRDWLVIAAATGVVAVHHIGFFILQLKGAPIFVFEPDHVTFSILLLHAVFAVAEGAVLIFVARRSFREGVGAEQLKIAIDQILSNPNKVNLTVPLDTSNESIALFSRFLTQIKTLIAESSRLTQDVAHASEIINQRAHRLAETSAEAVLEISTVTAASEEIAMTISHSNESTQFATEITSTARDTTEHSQQLISKANNSVSSLREVLNVAAKTNTELNSRCANISAAMQSITSVAEQTNLLALNAAIESARAGEHGRGFAVVADEVRTLAIRSKESADDITKIVEELVASTAESVAQIQRCVELVDDAVTNASVASEDMGQVVDQINSVAMNITQLSTSSNEQKIASESIAMSTAKMNEFSQNENHIAKDVSQKVDQLMAQCQSMQQAISRFVV